MSEGLSILYVMDPMDRIDIGGDSTFAFQREAQSRGHHNYHALVEELSVVDGEPVAVCRPLTVQAVEGDHFEAGPQETRPLRSFSCVMMRKDPPFNMRYVFATYILELVEEDIFMLNRPSTLRSANEKLYSLQFPEWIPETLVTTQGSQIRAFAQSVGGDCVIKPLDGAGGAGVFLLGEGDRNWNGIVEQVTVNGTRHVVVQRYLPAVVEEGDKRVILLNGEVIGATARVPASDDLRGNIHVGASCVSTTLSPREQQICAALGPVFREAGLWFVGIDLIGGFLTEINVTSPTGIQEINGLEGTRLEANVLDFVETQCS